MIFNMGGGGVVPKVNLAAKTWTPKTTNQTIAAGTYCTGKQTIKGDSNLKAANIKKGVSIFGVTGTFSESVKVSTGSVSVASETETIEISNPLGSADKVKAVLIYPNGTSNDYVYGCPISFRDFVNNLNMMMIRTSSSANVKTDGGEKIVITDDKITFKCYSTGTFGYKFQPSSYAWEVIGNE